MFTSLISNMLSGINIVSVLICAGVSILLGFVVALTFMFRNTYSKGLITTLVLLPLIAQFVIMMVSDNIGASVAVAGAFTLIRFRSAPGSAKEICAVFVAMAIGIINGRGYVWMAVLLTAVVCAIMFLLELLPFGNAKSSQKTLVVIIPEDLEYTGVFDDIFSEYLSYHNLIGVRSKNMGSLFELTYDVRIKDCSKEKELIDKIRARNGNLNVALTLRLNGDKPAL